MLNGLIEKLPLANYFREVHSELKKVSWPTRNETLAMTSLVIIASVTVSVYLGGLDYLFTQLVTSLVR